MNTSPFHEMLVYFHIPFPRTAPKNNDQCSWLSKIHTSESSVHFPPNVLTGFFYLLDPLDCDNDDEADDENDVRIEEGVGQKLLDWLRGVERKDGEKHHQNLKSHIEVKQSSNFMLQQTLIQTMIPISAQQSFWVLSKHLIQTYSEFVNHKCIQYP